MKRHHLGDSGSSDDENRTLLLSRARGKTRTRPTFVYPRANQVVPPEANIGRQSRGSTSERKDPFPVGVFFIFVLMLARDYALYGVSLIMVSYIRFLVTTHEGMDLNTADTIAMNSYNAFSLLQNIVFGMLGGFLADAYCGRYSICLWMSIVSSIGLCLLTYGSIPDTEYGIEDSPQQVVSSLGLMIIDIGLGAATPCILVFGADQFNARTQKMEISRFVRVFWFFKHLGVLAGTVITRTIVWKVNCMHETCYTLAFGLALTVMVLATILFIFGSPMYGALLMPEDNKVSQFFGCIIYSLVNWNTKSRRRRQPDTHHWLDFAIRKYGYRHVCEVKATLRIMSVFPFFMFCQCCHAEVLKTSLYLATRMDGNFGGLIALPSYLDYINSTLLIILLPLFDFLICPAIEYFNVHKEIIRPLRVIALGGTLIAMAAFILFGIDMYNTSIQDQRYKIGENKYGIDIHNGLKDIKGCELEVFLNKKKVDMNELPLILEEKGNLFMWKASKECGLKSRKKPHAQKLSLRKGKLQTLYFLKSLDQAIVGQTIHKVITTKPKDELPMIKMHWYLPGVYHGVFFLKDETSYDAYNAPFVDQFGDSQIYETHIMGDLQMCYRTMTNENTTETVCGERFHFLSGAAYDIFVSMPKKGRAHFDVVEKIEHNTLHMAWLAPANFLLALGEILFFVTGLELVFTQTPFNLSAFVIATFLMCTSIGSIIQEIGEGIFKVDSTRCVVSGAILLVNMVLLFAYSFFHTYVSDIDEIYEDEDNILEHPSQGIRYYRDVSVPSPSSSRDISESTSIRGLGMTFSEMLQRDEFS